MRIHLYYIVYCRQYINFIVSIRLTIYTTNNKQYIMSKKSITISKTTVEKLKKCKLTEREYHDTTINRLLNNYLKGEK